MVSRVQLTCSDYTMQFLSYSILFFSFYKEKNMLLPRAGKPSCVVAAAQALEATLSSALALSLVGCGTLSKLLYLSKLIYLSNGFNIRTYIKR